MALIIAWFNYGLAILGAIIGIIAFCFLSPHYLLTAIGLPAYLLGLEGLVIIGCLFHTLDKISKNTRRTAVGTKTVSNKLSKVIQNLDSSGQKNSVEAQQHKSFMGIHVHEVTVSPRAGAEYCLVFKGDILPLEEPQNQEKALEELAQLANIPVEQLGNSEVRIKNLSQEQAMLIKRTLQSHGIIVHMENQSSS